MKLALTHLTNTPTKIKSAFTLAETLITLGIIGIVAAITIPNLIHTYQEKQTVAKLKETYSILQQAIRTAEENEGELAGLGIKYDEDGAKTIAEHLLPYMKVATNCGTIDVENKCVVSERYKELNGNPRMAYAVDKRFYKFVLLNGTAVYLRGADAISSYNGKNNIIGIYIDTNGKAKPNQWGRDFFSFFYLDEGIGLVPTGHPDELTYSYQNTCMNKMQNGVGCAYYVMNFGNMGYLKK